MSKVLYFIDSFPNISETFLYNQIYYLSDNKVSLNLLAVKANKYQKEVFHRRMFEYNLFEKTSILRHGFSFFIVLNCLLFPSFTFRVIKKFKFKKALFFLNNFDIFSNYRSVQIIHAHYGHIGVLVDNLRDLGFFPNQKLICSFHGEELVPKFIDSYYSKYKGLIRNFDVVTVNSNYLRELVSSSLVGIENKLIVLPVALDSKLFTPAHRSTEDNQLFRLLFVGRLVKRKAPLLAIKIAHRLYQKGFDIRLDIIGSGTEYDLCLNYIIENNLEKNIFLRGALSQDRIFHFYNEADVFLFPGIKEPNTHRTEAQGLVIQEAQAMELPVIISDVGGMKYGMIDGETGFVVPENHLEGFVDRIEFLIKNPQVRSKMGKKGREFVLSNFDNEVLGKRLKEIYSLP